jgi:hypothetical protein
MRAPRRKSARATTRAFQIGSTLSSLAMPLKSTCGQEYDLVLVGRMAEIKRANGVKATTSASPFAASEIAGWRWHLAGRL